MMRKMRSILRICVALFAVCCMVFAMTGCGEKKTSVVELTFFFDSPCASCDDEEKFRTLLEEQAADLRQYVDYNLRCVNTFQMGDEEKIKMAKEAGFENPEQYNSLLFLNGQVLAGDAIAANLRQFYWQAAGLGTREEVVEYYYREDCPDCQSIKTEVDAYLDEKTEKPVVRVDTTDQQTKDAFRALIETQKVEPERYQIPYLIEDGVHYSGTEEILAHISGT